MALASAREGRYGMLLISLILIGLMFIVSAAMHLPSSHHRWSLLNSSVAQVDSLIGLTKSLSLGLTTVVVEDTRVAGHIQGSSINVVTPDTFILYISPWSMSETGPSVEIDLPSDTGESLVEPTQRKEGYFVFVTMLWSVIVVIISVIVLMRVIDRPIGLAGATRTATNGAAAGAPRTPEKKKRFGYVP